MLDSHTVYDCAVSSPTATEREATVLEHSERAKGGNR